MIVGGRTLVGPRRVTRYGAAVSSSVPARVPIVRVGDVEAGLISTTSYTPGRSPHTPSGRLVPGPLTDHTTAAMVLVCADRQFATAQAAGFKGWHGIGGGDGRDAIMIAIVLDCARSYAAFTPAVGMKATPRTAALDVAYQARIAAIFPETSHETWPPLGVRRTMLAQAAIDAVLSVYGVPIPPQMAPGGPVRPHPFYPMGSPHDNVHTHGVATNVGAVHAMMGTGGGMSAQPGSYHRTLLRGNAAPLAALPRDIASVKQCVAGFVAADNRGRAPGAQIALHDIEYIYLAYRCAGAGSVDLHTPGGELPGPTPAERWAFEHEWITFLRTFETVFTEHYGTGAGLADKALNQNQLAQLGIDCAERWKQRMAVPVHVGEAADGSLLIAGMNSPPPAADGTMAEKFVHYTLGDAYPHVVAGTTVIGGIAGYVFGGPLAVILGFLGGNVAGRIGAFEAQKVGAQF